MEMDETNVMVNFRILGKDFNPDDLTSILNITPSSQWLKGEIIRPNIVRKYSCWIIGTEYEESCDINVQLKKVLKKISERKRELIDLREKLDLQYRLDVVINIENNEKPAIYLNSDVIEFANDIKAEFDFDLYIF